MAHMAVDPTFAKTAEIISHATVALDGKENAMQWLQQPHPNLSNKTPLEVLSHGSPEERQAVDDLLTALEYGMYT